MAKLNNQKSTIYYLIGIPASGKSTFSKKLQDKFKIPILSSDELRKELTGDPGDVETISNPKIFNILRQRADKLIKEKKDFIWDATNIASKFRREDLNYWKDFPSQIKAILMVTPKEIAKKRNLERNRVVPEKIIENMYERLIKEPINTLFDKFDEIIIIDQNGKELKIYNRESSSEKKFEVKVSPKEFTPFKY